MTAKYVHVALLAIAVLLASGSGRAGTPQYSQIMPLASKSLLLDIAAAGPRMVAVGERGHILYSDNGGDSWQQARVPTTQMLTCVYFIDAERGWAAGHDGLILVSDDSGVSWRIQRDGIAVQQQTNLELREIAYEQVKLLEREIAGADPSAREDLDLQLEDALLDLEDAALALEEPAFAPPLMDIWFEDRQRGWAVGAFGSLVSTDNGGRTWSPGNTLIDNPEEFHLYAVTGDGEGSVFIAGEAGGMYRSLDGGNRWQTLTPFYQGSWFGALYNSHSAALLLFGLRGNLYRSEDFGDNWQAVRLDNQMTLAGGSSGPGERVALVGAVGTLLQSVDGGRNFKLSILPDRLSLSSAVYQDKRLVLVGQGGVKVFRNQDQP